MALKKKIENQDGSFVEYHKISRMDIYFIDKVIDVYVQSYVDMDKRFSGKTPMLLNCFRTDIIDAEIPALSDIYIKLKTSDIFVGAEDI